MVAQTGCTRAIVLQNAPALPSGVDANPKASNELSLGPLQVGPIKGLVQGYSRTAIRTAFRPAAVGMVQQQIMVSFRQGFAAGQMQTRTGPVYAVVHKTCCALAVPFQLCVCRCCLEGAVYCCARLLM